MNCFSINLFFFFTENWLQSLNVSTSNSSIFPPCFCGCSVEPFERQQKMSTDINYNKHLLKIVNSTFFFFEMIKFQKFQKNSLNEWCVNRNDANNWLCITLTVDKFESVYIFHGCENGSHFKIHNWRLSFYISIFCSLIPVEIVKYGSFEQLRKCVLPIG